MTQTTTFQKPERLILHLSALALGTLAEEQGDRVYPATMLKPGIFTPGIGNPGEMRPARVRFTAAIIERMAPTMEGKKVNLEHKQDAENEVGFVSQVKVAEGTLRGSLHLQPVRPKYPDALGFVEGRLKAGKVPEVSVEVVRPQFREAETDEERALFDLDLIGGEFDGVSILPKGACSAEAGCGIGLSEAEKNVLGLCACSKVEAAGSTSIPAPRIHDPNAPPGSPANPSHAPPAPEGAPDERIEVDTMPNDEKPGAHGSGGNCNCGGAGSVAALERKVAELEQTLKAEQTEHTKAKESLKAAGEKVAAFEKAEKDALLAGFKDAAKKANLSDEEVVEVLGMKPEEADRSALRLGHAVLTKLTAGKRVGMGRHTAGAEASPTTTPEDYEKAMKARLGLTEGKSNLPRGMQRNNAILRRGRGA